MLAWLFAMSAFLPPTDPQLNAKANPICACHIKSQDTQKVLDQMFEVAYGESQDRSRAVLVGLAAPQIGIQKRIILVDLAATGIFTEQEGPPPPQLKEFINPEIIWQSEEVSVWREGCFSTSNICGLVPRPNRILIRAYDRNGLFLTQEFSGYTARIFCHEIDHLDGIRFPDRVARDVDLHWVEESEIPAYRIHWMNWNHLCPRSAWEQMKNPR